MSVQVNTYHSSCRACSDWCLSFLLRKVLLTQAWGPELKFLGPMSGRWERTPESVFKLHIHNKKNQHSKAETLECCCFIEMETWYKWLWNKFIQHLLTVLYKTLPSSKMRKQLKSFIFFCKSLFLMVCCAVVSCLRWVLWATCSHTYRVISLPQLLWIWNHLYFGKKAKGSCAVMWLLPVKMN